MVQHAILDLNLQRHGLALLTEVVAKKEGKPFMLVLLKDRVLMQEGQLQVYGTQYAEVKEGGVEPWPIANTETVDKLPDRTRLQRLLGTHQDWKERFLADPSFS